MQTFIDRQALWKAGGGMEMEVKEQTDRAMCSTSRAAGTPRCIARWASARLGICSPVNATQPSAKDTTSDSRLNWPQTLMQGASHCNFDYKLLDDAQQS